MSSGLALTKLIQGTPGGPDAKAPSGKIFFRGASEGHSLLNTRKHNDEVGLGEATLTRTRRADETQLWRRPAPLPSDGGCAGEPLSAGKNKESLRRSNCVRHDQAMPHCNLKGPECRWTGTQETCAG